MDNGWMEIVPLQTHKKTSAPFISSDSESNTDLANKRCSCNSILMNNQVIINHMKNRFSLSFCNVPFLRSVLPFHPTCCSVFFYLRIWQTFCLLCRHRITIFISTIYLSFVGFASFTLLVFLALVEEFRQFVCLAL